MNVFFSKSNRLDFRTDSNDYFNNPTRDYSSDNSISRSIHSNRDDNFHVVLLSD